MNTDLKAEWIRRLRSGDIKKGKYYLHDNEGRMCTIGILCEIMAEQGTVKKIIVDDPERLFYRFTEYDDGISLPPPRVGSEISGHLIKLLAMNESQSFKKIADYIEKEM